MTRSTDNTSSSRTLPFTPVTRDGKRHNWKQSDLVSSYQDVRGYGYKNEAHVNDITYRIYGASCGLGSDCICDALALDTETDADLIAAIDELIELGAFPERE